MFYVYILRSESHPEQTYVGFSEDLKQRLQTHNQGGSIHTAKFAPWRIEFYCAFKGKDRALEFERYLKSHSGKAFANKRLLPTSSQK
jgi:predicted GIY-YIG superfamily endonuclease